MSSDPVRVPEQELDGLYRELYPTLVRFSQGIVGTRSDAEDAVQDAFTAAARAQPAENPRPWLFRITRNASIDLLRRRRPTVPLEAVEPAGQAPGSASPHSAAELSEQLDALRVALAALPERGRTALLLRELAGLPYEEIGEVLDTSEGNVKVLVFRARASLHAMAEAAELECDGVQVTLSAAADGEAGRAERARAQLHTVHCRSCRSFAASIGSNRTAIAALAPIAIPHAAHIAGGGGTFAGGLASAKAALAGVLVTTAAVGVTAGGVAIVHDSHSQAHRRPVAAPPTGAARSGAPKRAHKPAVVTAVPVTTAAPPKSSSGGSSTGSTSTGGTGSEQDASWSSEPADSGETEGGSTRTRRTSSDDGTATHEHEPSDDVHNDTEGSGDGSSDDGRGKDS